MRKIIKTNGAPYIEGDIYLNNGDFITGHKIVLNFTAAFIEKIIRWIVSLTGWGKSKFLDELFSESKARCIARWQAVGLSNDEANGLFLDESIGREKADLIFDGSKPVQILVGDQGAGKSLIAERCFQSAIKDIKNNRHKPLPIFLEARQINDSLINEILRKSYRLGYPETFGILLIIDGVDEIGTNAIERYITEARILVNQWPKTNILITTRPFNRWEEKSEKVSIRALSQVEYLKLINLVSNRDIKFLYDWPESIRKVIKRPLFALLVGLYLKAHEENPFTIGDLLTNLINYSTNHVRTDKERINNQLQKIAQLSIDRGGALIPFSEIGLPDEIVLLFETRLLTEHSHCIGFTLPLINQWYAAISLLENSSKFDEILNSPLLLNRWKYPIIILATILDYDKSKLFFEKIIRHQPGFVAQVIDGSIPENLPLDKRIALPPSRELAEKIHLAMGVWKDGLGVISPATLPINNEGDVRSLGYIDEDEWITISWYSGDHSPDAVVNLHDLNCKLPNDEWNNLHSFRKGIHPSWVWKYTLDLVKENLERITKNNCLLLSDGFSYREFIWMKLVKILGYGEYYFEPFDIRTLEEELVQNHRDQIDIIQYIRNLQKTGESQFSPVCPSPNISINQGCWIWEPYTPERILERARFVYSSALIEYAKLVDFWFPGFKNQLTTYQLFPVKFMGRIQLESDGIGNPPTIFWYLDPLPKGEKNQLDISFGDNERSNNNAILNQLLIDIHQYRPELDNRVGATVSGGILDIFMPNPITHVIYKWLRHDLRSIKWL